MIYKKKEISFYPMNMVMKGTASAIAQALSMPGVPSFEWEDDQNYNSCQADPQDQSMKVARVVFDPEQFITSFTIPFASQKDVKFIMLGSGGTAGEADGTYAIFKNFGSDSVDFCNQFTQANVHMSEFDNPNGNILVNTIFRSFLTTRWSFRYEDDSDGMTKSFRYPYKEKELWEDDSLFGGDVPAAAEKKTRNRAKKGQKTPKAGDLKTPQISQMPFGEPSKPSAPPEISLGDYVFQYSNIDQIPDSFLCPLRSGEEKILPIEDACMNIDGFQVKITMKSQYERIAQLLDQPELGWYAPAESCLRMFKSSLVPFTLKSEEMLSDCQMQSRISVFLRLCQLCTNTEVVKKILQDYPRKKNGMLHKKRIHKIAFLHAVDWKLEHSAADDSTFFSGFIFQLYATAQSETELCIDVRRHRIADPQQFIEIDDMSVRTNLFSKAFP